MFCRRRSYASSLEVQVVERENILYWTWKFISRRSDIWDCERGEASGLSWNVFGRARIVYSLWSAGQRWVRRETHTGMRSIRNANGGVGWGEREAMIGRRRLGLHVQLSRTQAERGSQPIRGKGGRERRQRPTTGQKHSSYRTTDKMSRRENTV